MIGKGLTATSPSPVWKLPTVPSVSGFFAVLILNRLLVPASGGKVTVSYDTYHAPAAASCMLASFPRLWTGPDPVAVPCDGSSFLTVGAATGSAHWTLSFSATAGGRTTTASRTLVQWDLTNNLAQATQNWSGYVISSLVTVAGASGVFTIPRLDCSATPDASESTWVGTGGDLPGQVLLQTGVRSQCAGGVQENYPWWEMVPGLPEEDFTGFLMFSGDVMQANVYPSLGGRWTTRLDNLTTGWSGWMITGEGWGVAKDGAPQFPYQGTTTGLAYKGATTAEWVIEAPTDQAGQVETLADYQTVAFTELRAGLAFWWLTPEDGLELTQGAGGLVISTPELPLGDGFSVNYTG